MARLTAGLWSCNSVAPSARAAERRRLRELLHEHPAIRLDDALRRDVIRIRGEFDVAQAGLVHFVEELLQGLRRIAPALLPGNRGTVEPSGRGIGPPAPSLSTRLARKAVASFAMRASSSRAATAPATLSGDQPR